MIATSLATEEAVIARLREHIIVLLGQTVTAVRADVTLQMRADAIVDPQQEVRLGMTEMSNLVAVFGHPTEMREINMTSLVEITTKITGNRCSDHDSTPIQVVTSNLPSIRLETNPTVQTVTSIPAADSTTQSVRVEEPTLKSGATPTVENNSLVFSSQPHNTIIYESARS